VYPVGVTIDLYNSNTVTVQWSSPEATSSTVYFDVFVDRKKVAETVHGTSATVPVDVCTTSHTWYVGEEDFSHVRSGYDAISPTGTFQTNYHYTPADPYPPDGSKVKCTYDNATNACVAYVDLSWFGHPCGVDHYVVTVNGKDYTVKDSQLSGFYLSCPVGQECSVSWKVTAYFSGGSSSGSRWHFTLSPSGTIPGGQPPSSSCRKYGTYIYWCPSYYSPGNKSTNAYLYGLFRFVAYLDSQYTNVKFQGYGIAVYSKPTNFNPSGPDVVAGMGPFTDPLPNIWPPIYYGDYPKDPYSGKPVKLKPGTTYYWQTYALLLQPDNTAALEWTPLFQFTTAYPPYIPKLIYPANNSKNLPLNLKLQWEGGDPANNLVVYSIYFGKLKDLQGKIPPFYTNVTKTELELKNLDPGTTYVVKLNATNDKGASVDPVYVFTTTNPPYTPSNPSPSNGAYGLVPPVTLSWTGGDPDGDPVTYSVYIGTSQNDLKFYTNTTSTSVTVSDLSINTTYYWMVVATDDKGVSTKGPTWYFITNRYPYVPSNPSPIQNAYNVPKDTTLSWSGGDPDNDPVTYDVYLGTSSSNIPFYKTVSVSYVPVSLQAHTVYYWYVVAKDSKGLSSKGPVWSFSTLNNPPYIPSDPIPNPGAMGVNLTTVLAWRGGDPDNDTVTYDVYLGTDPNPPFYKTVSAPSLKVTLKNDTTYYWYVKAKDSLGAVSTGPLWSFTTNRHPYVPSNPSPANGSTNVPLNVTLSWIGGDPDGDKVTYDVYLGTDPSKLPLYTTTTEPSVSVSNLKKYTTYYWYVVAKDDKGLSAKSPVWMFITLNNPPYMPFNPYPANGEMGVRLKINLSWSGGDPDNDTVTYSVYLGKDMNKLKFLKNTTDNSLYVELEPDTTYYWYVKATDDKGATTTGPLWSFTTNRHPYVPSNPSPPDKATNQPTSIILSWVGGDPDGDPVTYYVYLGNRSVNIPLFANTTLSYISVSNLSSATTYYWYVVAVDDKNLSTRGPVWSFSTFGAPAPTGGGISGVPAVGYSWVVLLILLLLFFVIPLIYMLLKKRKEGYWPGKKD
jgi:ribosomal protein L31